MEWASIGVLIPHMLLLLLGHDHHFLKKIIVIFVAIFPHHDVPAPLPVVVDEIIVFVAVAFKKQRWRAFIPLIDQELLLTIPALFINTYLVINCAVFVVYNGITVKEVSFRRNAILIEVEKAVITSLHLLLVRSCDCEEIKPSCQWIAHAICCLITIRGEEKGGERGRLAFLLLVLVL